MRLNMGDETVLVIPDLQIPFEHPDALAFIIELEARLNPTEIISVGDEVDQMALSRYDPDPDADGPTVELSRSIDALQDWYAAFPEMKVCESNHTVRVYKKAFAAGIPTAYMRDVKEWLDAPPGWEWRKSWAIDGVRYEHGDAQGGMFAARNIAIRNRQSTVIGHHHSHGAVFYIANESEMIFGMNVGCLIDINAIAFRYAKDATFKPTLGAGVVANGVPYFVPMLINEQGRWTGEIVV